MYTSDFDFLCVWGFLDQYFLMRMIVHVSKISALENNSEYIYNLKLFCHNIYIK